MKAENFTYTSTGSLEKTAVFFMAGSEKTEKPQFFGLDLNPYGKLLRSFQGGSGHERYLTTQHERDAETISDNTAGTGFDNRGARLYDSDVARFLSLDPHATDYPSWSDYAYVLGNPITYIDPDGKNAWKPVGNGQWEAEVGDGAETLSQDAGISLEEAYKVMEQQGYGTYVDEKDGVTKSAVDPGQIVQLPFEKEAQDLTDPIKVDRFENKLDQLNSQMEQTTTKLIEVTKDYNHYRKGPQGASPDPSTGLKIGYGINALRKELQMNRLKDDTSQIGKSIRSYQDSLKIEIEK